MAYFDNAATTYPKPDCVCDFMDSFYRTSGANAGRGNYKLAQSAGALIGDTRKKIQELLHCKSGIFIIYICMNQHVFSHNPGFHTNR